MSRNSSSNAQGNSAKFTNAKWHTTTHSKPSDIRTELGWNSVVYVSSLMDPFGVRGARIPESTPFPSTVGSYVNRFTSAGVEDKGLTPTKKISGMFFGIDPCINGVWTATITDYSDAFVESWTTAAHPYAEESAYVFQLVRTVSRGVKIINISTLLSRGGALYVSYAAVRPSTGILADLRLAQETEVYDAARLTKEGLTCVYLPLTSMPMLAAEGENPQVFLPGSSYVNPANDHKVTSPMFDCNIFIWVEGSVDQDLTLEWEEVQNWEAIPWPIAESLFDRKAVMSSDDAKATAMAAASPTRSSTAQKKGTSGWDKFKAGLLGTAKTVGKFALEQVATVATAGLASLPMAIFGQDVKNHRLALVLKRADLSPVNNRGLRGLTAEEFRARVFAALDDPVVVHAPGPAPATPIPAIRSRVAGK